MSGEKTFPDNNEDSRVLLNKIARKLDDGEFALDVYMKGGVEVYTKSEVDALVATAKPYPVKISMPTSSLVTYTDFEGVVDNIAANTTGTVTVTFVPGFVPRSFSFAAQSNVTVGYSYPIPTDGTIQLVFKLVSTGGNFNPNEVIVNFYKA